MFYVKKTKRWEADKKALPRAPVANAASNQPPPAPVPPSIPAIPNDATKLNKDLAMTNYTHQINVAMQGLTNAMRDA
jgi:hypothetical protein